MANARAMIAVKFSIDVLSIVLIFVTYFVYFFEYMKEYRIYARDLEIHTSNDGLDYFVIGSFNSVCDHLCDNSEAPCGRVCRYDDDFKSAGICYMAFSAASLVVMAYCLAHLMGLACGCTFFGLLKFKWMHFVFPLVYAIALILYISISRVFTLTKGIYPSSYSVKAGPGIVFIFIVQALMLISSGYFFYALRNGIEDVLLVTQTGYRAVSESEGKPTRSSLPKPI
jgi:hypothetical protein